MAETGDFDMAVDSGIDLDDFDSHLRSFRARNKARKAIAANFTNGIPPPSLRALLSTSRSR